VTDESSASFYTLVRVNFINILAFSHLYLNCSSGLFHSGILIKILYAFLMCVACATGCGRLIFLYLIIPIICTEEHKLYIRLFITKFSCLLPLNFSQLKIYFPALCSHTIQTFRHFFCTEWERGFWNIVSCIYILWYSYQMVARIRRVCGAWIHNRGWQWCV
jgi:hypothetical protein